MAVSCPQFHFPSQRNPIEPRSKKKKQSRKSKNEEQKLKEEEPK